MKRHLLPFLLIITACVTNIRAETEMIDLKALAKKARPAVMLLIVSDANGKEIATATGFMVSADGKLITNYHVVRNAAALVAKAENGSEFPAMSVLVEDSLNDLALVRIKGRDFAFLSLGAGDNAEVGSRIAVIGSPLGLEGTLSEGIISAVRVSPEGQRVLQISAAISPGSSGSPVLNAYGEVIGVAAAKRPGGESLNFAAPVKAAKVILAQGETAVAQRSFNEGVPQQGNSESGAQVDNGGPAGDRTEAGWFYGSRAYERFVATQAKTWYNRAIDSQNSGGYPDAITGYKHAIALYPEFPEAWNNLGTAYDETGQVADAIEAYRKAIELKPDHPKAWFNLGSAYAKNRQCQKAEDVLRRLEKLNRGYAAELDAYIREHCQ